MKDGCEDCGSPLCDHGFCPECDGECKQCVEEDKISKPDEKRPL